MRKVSSIIGPIVAALMIVTAGPAQAAINVTNLTTGTSGSGANTSLTAAFTLTGLGSRSTDITVTGGYTLTGYTCTKPNGNPTPPGLQKGTASVTQTVMPKNGRVDVSTTLTPSTSCGGQGTASWTGITWNSLSIAVNATQVYSGTL